MVKKRRECHFLGEFEQGALIESYRTYFLKFFFKRVLNYLLWFFKIMSSFWMKNEFLCKREVVEWQDKLGEMGVAFGFREIIVHGIDIGRTTYAQDARNQRRTQGRLCKMPDTLPSEVCSVPVREIRQEYSTRQPSTWPKPYRPPMHVR